MNCAKGMTPWGCGGEQPPSAIRHGLTGDRKALHTTKGQPRRPRAVAQRLRSAGPTHVSDMAPSRSGGVAGRRRALLPSVGGQRNLPLGKSGPTIFGTQTFESPDPPPPFLTLPWGLSRAVRGPRAGPAQPPAREGGGGGTYSTRAGAAPRAPGGVRHGGGNRAVNSQPRTRQSTLYGDVKSSYGGTGGGARQGHPGAPTDGGRSNTDTQNAGATPEGTRAGTPDKEGGHSKAGEATRTAGTGNQNGADGRACAWEAATIKGMAWPANPVATGCQGNPCSTGIRWGVSPAAQMGCLRNRSGSPSGADQP